MATLCSASGALVIMLISGQLLPIYAPGWDKAKPFFVAAYKYAIRPSAKLVGQVGRGVGEKYVSDNYITNMGSQGQKLRFDLVRAKALLDKAFVKNPENPAEEGELKKEFDGLAPTEQDAFIGLPQFAGNFLF